MPQELRASTACSKYWTTAVSGDWSDSARWSPSGVPSWGDHVCFDAAGVYTVFMPSYTVDVDGLEVGSGVAVTLDGQLSPPAIGMRDIFVSSSLVVDRTGRLSTTGCVTLVAFFPVVIDGNLTLRDQCLRGHWFGALEVAGILELDSTWVRLGFGGVGFRKRGDMTLSNTSRIILASFIPAVPIIGDVVFESGRVLGSGSVSFVGTPGSSARWNGGSLPQRATVTGPAKIVLDSMDLMLGSSSISGAIDVLCIAAATRRVRGPVPTATDVGLVSSASAVSTCELRSPSANAPYAPVVIDGRILVRGNGAASVRVSSNAAIANHGTFTTTGGDVDLDVDQLVNHGTLSVQSRTQFGSGVPSRLQNLGLVSVSASPAQLSIKRGAFDAAAGTRMLGSLELTAGTRLTGSGHVGVVTSAGGSIAPGPTLGTLTMDALSLDAASRVTLEIVDTRLGGYDRLVINGVASYAGTLDAPPLGAFVPGSCGQVIPAITDNTSKTGLPRGSFTQFAGTPSGQPRAWRAHYPTDSVLLVGYDPTTDLGITPMPLAVTEGGPGVAANVCLGNHAPTANVSVKHLALNSQFTAAPSSLTFLPTNWVLPQRLTLAAVNDAVGEGPHTDYLRHALTSADPFYAGRTLPDVPVAIADNDPGADLTLAFVIAGTATVGSPFDARFRVTNNGPAASTGSTFSLAPMSGITFGGVFTPGVTCTPGSGIVTCTIGALAAGASIDVNFDFNAATAGAHVNTASITGFGYDHVSGNNSAIWNLTVNP
jgi:hypothetical protein